MEVPDCVKNKPLSASAVISSASASKDVRSPVSKLPIRI
jgi:hypothetical protein